MILEIKLGDKNYHPGYEKWIPVEPNPTYLALIANHRVPATSKWVIKEWRAFTKDFEDKYKQYGDYASVFAAYLTYVKEICSMSDFDAFHFDINSLLSMTNLIRMLNQVLEDASTSRYEVTHRNSEDFGESWAGYTVTVKPRELDVIVKLFVGLDFSEEGGRPSLTVDLHRGYNPDYYPTILNLKASKSYNKRVLAADGLIQLRMPVNDFIRLNATTPKDKQIEELHRFLDACCTALANLLVSMKSEEGK